MSMKPLQNDFTTPEQSKRLLELGVPADSADVVIYPFDDGTFREFILRDGENFRTHKWIVDGAVQPVKYPCWSVGRLIEIYMIAAGLQWIDLCLPDDFTESIVKMFMGTKDLDFSKLED